MFGSIKNFFGKAPAERDVQCPICKASATHLDSVDFNKTCGEAWGLHLPDTGVLISYHLCDQCGFCFAPEFSSWSFNDFEDRIYNEGYEAVDPEYKHKRPIGNAGLLGQIFELPNGIRHLDYGGGSGLLSETLRSRNWDSHTYDPFVDRDVEIEELGQFDLITAFEVFEHVPDVHALFSDLQKLSKPTSLILFSTLLSNGEIQRGRPLTWWYASPRNGHISLFSSRSMQTCMYQYGLQFRSFSPALHVAFREIPDWASHINMPPPAV